MTVKKNTAALLRCVAEILDPQPPVDMTEDTARVVAEVISAQFGKGIVGRGFTAGTGVEVAF